jgi:hypothetical protein
MDSRESCLALIASIPTMQVENLEFSIYSGFQHVKAGIVQAVKRNGSLRNVFANQEYCLDWLDDGDSGKLISYTERNKLLVQWTENPTVVPKAAWSEYFLWLRPVDRTPSLPFFMRSRLPWDLLRVSNVESAAVPIFMFRLSRWSGTALHGIEYLRRCIFCMMLLSKLLLGTRERQGLISRMAELHTLYSISVQRMFKL